MAYTISSMKGILDRPATYETLVEARQSAHEVNEILQPAYGVDIEGPDGLTVETVGIDEETESCSCGRKECGCKECGYCSSGKEYCGRHVDMGGAQ